MYDHTNIYSNKDFINKIDSNNIKLIYLLIAFKKYVKS